MFAKKFAGAAAVAALIAGVTVPALAADDLAAAEAALKAAQLDAEYVCAEDTEYYDMAKCAVATDEVKKAEAKVEELKKAAEPADPAPAPAPATDTVKEKIKDVALDAQYFCAEGTEYFDHVKCASLTAEKKDLEKKDAELDALYFCAEGTEYYDVVKCADAKAKAGTTPAPIVKESVPMTPLTPATEIQSGADDKMSHAVPDKKMSNEKKADAQKAGLAKTGATVGVLGAFAALTAVAGAAVVATRKRA